ncbi:MAG: hypothetical protein KME29_15290 [Calothrix sp. FI2-JRJ7]|jgi:hypothetical protein|nr:hypothetical protein [Calothrix sp. FI2-JRJ7]
MQRLSTIAIGAAFIALGTCSTTPVTAALLDFSFTTSSGATGSFILDTDTAVNPFPAIGLNNDGTYTEIGLSYPNAVSNFSVSAGNINLRSVAADFGVFPAIALNPASTGILSSIEYPSGCLTTTGFFCSIDVDLGYSGNVSELPVLSDDPLSYSTNIVLRVANSTTGIVSEDAITRLQVTNLQAVAVPEPNFGLGTLAIGVGGVGLLVKRTINRKKRAKNFKPIKPLA